MRHLMGYGLLLAMATTGCQRFAEMLPTAGAENDTEEAASKSKRAPPVPRCAATYELTADERYEVVQELDDGKTVCPRWARPEIEVASDAVWLNGENVVDGGFAAGNVALVTPLWRALKGNRDKWKSFHPNAPYPGEVTIEFADGLGTDVGLSVLHSVGLAGLAKMKLRADGVSLALRWSSPRRAEGADATLYVEALPEGRRQVAMVDAINLAGPYPVAVRHLETLDDEAALERWFEAHCPQRKEGRPCADHVRLRAAEGSMSETLEEVVRLRRLANGQGVAKTTFSVTFQCFGGNYLDIPHHTSPWGPRWPTEACPLRARPEPPPEEKTAPPPGGGTLPPEVIQRVVRQSFGRFRYCYEEGLARNPSLRGRIEVTFVIGLDGRVRDARAETGFPEPSVNRCIVDGFETLRFPAPEGGIVSVKYPIVFEPG
ncbi:MAG: AgmX/PglI C-terminal domain-containing protein [Myxococcota bacterium]